MVWKKFDCPNCGQTYVDYKNLDGLKHGGKICEECDFHIDLENVENVREVIIRGRDPAYRIYTEDGQSWLQEFPEDPHPDNANSIDRVEPLYSRETIVEVIEGLFGHVNGPLPAGFLDYKLEELKSEFRGLEQGSDDEVDN